MDEQKNIKKKKSHFFEIYIIKVLKQICETSEITSNAKQQLNSVLCLIAKNISYLVLNLIQISKKKTISYKEIINALKFILNGELLNNSIIEGEKAKENFETNKNENICGRQNKAEIIFPPALTEKFLRKFGFSKVMVTSTAPIYLAAVLEYLCFEILDISNTLCKESKRVRINIRDLELSIRSDEELNNLFNKLNINFLGGGVVPFIHSSLLIKTNKVPLKHNNTNINRRYHSGTVAIRNMKKQQKFSDSLIFAKLSFEHFVRQIFKENNCIDIKLSKDIFIVLQYFIEQYTVNILSNANFLAIHANRVKLTPVDIGLISFFYNKSKNPYNNEYIDDNIEIFSLQEEENIEEE